MLAAVYYGAEDIRVEEREVPSIAQDEMLLRIDTASICATDLRILQGDHRKYGPGTIRVPGHEIVGTLAEVGRDVEGYRAGQSVFVAPNVGCGHCRQCREGRNNLCPDYDAFGITLDGSFAQYMRITAPAIEQGNVISFDSTVDSTGMSLAEPFACVLHGQDQLRVSEGDVVLVQGAGPIGLMHLLLARRRGAKRVFVSEQSPQRISMARELGADSVIDIGIQNLDEAVLDLTGGAGADVVVVATAARMALDSALRVAAVCGRINFFAGLPKDRSAIEVDANILHYKEIVLTGSTGCSTRDCRRAVELVVSGGIDLRRLISGRFALGEMIAALAAAQDRNGLKVIVQPAGEEKSN